MKHPILQFLTGCICTLVFLSLLKWLLEPADPTTPPPPPPRFTSTGPLPTTMHVITDTKTGREYLYVWNGDGIAITPILP